jgi:ABC-type cobalamin/Fe3+-siderophores transport system ATPase subunit
MEFSSNEFLLAILSDALNRAITLLDSLLRDLFSNHTSIKIMEHSVTLDLNQFEDSTFYDKMERARQRAYMRDAQLMILDEPTAALDARAEYEVFQRFAELTKGRTAVFISHRFSTVRMADRILVLNKGQLEEIGSHEELLQKNGRYAELFRLQAKGYQ